MTFDKRVLVAAGGVIVAAALVTAWLSAAPRPADGATAPIAPTTDEARDTPTTSDKTPSPASTSTASTDADAALARARAVYTQGSLRDSTRDGRVTLGADGKPVADRELRRLFDWYLAVLGEIDVTQIRAVMAADLREELGEATAQAVLAIFDRYVGYQQAQARMQRLDGETQRQQFARLRALRRQWLGEAEASAMFGEDEAYTEYTLTRLDIARDQKLDAATRARRLAELEATLPTATREMLREAGSAALIDEQTRQFDALRVDPAQRDQERQALWGREAAQRLATLDRQRADWDARVARYVSQRNTLRDQHRNDPARAEQLVTQLRARSFDDNEARRVASLESIGQL